MLKLSPTVILGAAALALLAGCGGSSPPANLPVEPPPVTPPPVDPPPPVNPPPVTPPPVEPPRTVQSLWYVCEKPRTGLDSNNLPFMDRQGTLRDELDWLRLYHEESYLWYRELPALRPADYRNPLDYFAALKTPMLTSAGHPKDRFHFTYPSAKWDAISKGEEFGYGVSWAKSEGGTAPRIWRVTMVQPGSAADQAGVRRGDQLQLVDGADFMHTNDSALLERINAALLPARAGETHTFTLLRGSQTLRAEMTSSMLNLDPVRNVRILDTPDGKVGYLTFNNHNNAAEGALVSAFTRLQQAGVGDLVLDMRYNGGGLLLVASELAYMIAGPQHTEGKVFEQTKANDKSKVQSPIMFRGKAVGLPGPEKVVAGQALPYLGLKRVMVLTGPGTCSASESVINSLRGIDVEVVLLGGATCGKPYAFTPAANCGTTYFTIQYQGVNHKGFGDYGDGFTPSCPVADDFSHELGDPQEGQLAAALRYKSSGTCSAPRSSRAQAAALPQLVPVRSQMEEISVHTPPR
ncbi:S41 family peptidase [Massilia sp. erpn]|uniref:S41 family peptidase n=1 Tax=Massilia sp. erpn TaxID=2738142 RepID=UPI0021023A4D|nr:S41 family peptidase [Massilia sp. erpn]UTY56817.1 peptidase S41 [Massilia sp. erpn]